jgi:hypothetical protein
MFTYWINNDECERRSTADPTREERFLVRKNYSSPFWLIVKYRTGGMEVLRTALASGRKALPVFSFEDEARMFLELGAPGGWRVRETTAGEITSVLFDPCAGVGRVVLDPPLRGPFAEAPMDLASLGREAFIETYLKNEESWRLAAGLGHRRRQGEEIAPRATLERWLTAMWGKLFGDELPREKVDAVVRVVDRYLSEEAELRGLQTEKQTIHPRDLSPDKRRDLIEGVFAILGEPGKG